MKITGSYTIDAPREQVWDALNDIDVLARVVPGCQRLEQTGENEFEGTIKIGIQTIRGTYNGRIRLEDVQPPQHYKLIANGKSANGIVDGTGNVDLEDHDGKTLLKYSGDANVAGTLAGIGQRLIEGAAKQIINQSLKALVEQVNKRAAGTADPLPSEEPAHAPAAEPASSQNGSAPVPAANALVAASMIGQAAAAAASAPAAPPSETPAPAAAPPTFQSRAVSVPDSEQLKPETMALGMASDFYAERPWIPWVIIAFLLGYIFGRGQS